MEKEVMMISFSGHADGAESLDEIIEIFQNFLEWLKDLAAEGWELDGPVDDDCGFLKK